MVVTQEMKRKLAEMIVSQIKEDFRVFHYSGNLASTIKIITTKNSVSVEVPAEIYDLRLYNRTGAIVYTGEGSYADDVNEQGGFSGRHKNYVEKSISYAIRKWISYYGIKARIL